METLFIDMATSQQNRPETLAGLLAGPCKGGMATEYRIPNRGRAAGATVLCLKNY
jgi:hypothetical protein